MSPVLLQAKKKLLNEATMRNPIMETNGIDNHVSVSEALAADIEVMNSRLLVSEGHKMVILKIRPIVQFKMGVGML